MSDGTPETTTGKNFNPEAFGQNLARALECSGRALSAYLGPNEKGQVKDQPPSELTDVITTFSSVADYWLSDQQRTADLQLKIGKA